MCKKEFPTGLLCSYDGPKIEGDPSEHLTRSDIEPNDPGISNHHGRVAIHEKPLDVCSV